MTDRQKLKRKLADEAQKLIDRFAVIGWEFVQNNRVDGIEAILVADEVLQLMAKTSKEMLVSQKGEVK